MFLTRCGFVGGLRTRGPIGLAREGTYGSLYVLCPSAKLGSATADRLAAHP